MFDHKGWSKVLDQKSGKFYYWNSANNEVQWLFEGTEELANNIQLVRGVDSTVLHSLPVLHCFDPCSPFS